jgi:nitric oxide reductase subunit B
LGVLQLYHSVAYGYYDARSLKFVGNPTNALIEWLRLPGDTVFILGGTLPVLYLCWLGVRHMRTQITVEEPRDILFTELAGGTGGR